MRATTSFTVGTYCYRTQFCCVKKFRVVFEQYFIENSTMRQVKLIVLKAFS